MAKGDSIKTMEELAKQGNKNIKGLVNKDIVIKRRRYK